MKKKQINYSGLFFVSAVMSISAIFIMDWRRALWGSRDLFSYLDGFALASVVAFCVERRWLK